MTTTMLEQTDENKKKERVRTMATSKEFKYEDELRRGTYTGDVHLNGPQGDVVAAKFELYLKPSGDELERAEGYDPANASRFANKAARRPARASPIRPPTKSTSSPGCR